MTFDEAVRHLLHGDFSLLEPHQSQILEWAKEGRFAAHADALAEALSAACFVGRTDVAEYLLAHGVDPAAGNRTGLDALHWAADRGQLDAVRLLLRHHAPLDRRNMYGGTALGAAVWSATHTLRPAHLQIIEELLKAGARTQEVEVPTANPEINAILEGYRGLEV